jgi:hypothetical protein
MPSNDVVVIGDMTDPENLDEEVDVPLKVGPVCAWKGAPFWTYVFYPERIEK